ATGATVWSATTTVLSDGTVRPGPAVPCTRTVNISVATLCPPGPEPSVLLSCAVQLMVVSPSGNALPEESPVVGDDWQSGVTDPSTASVAVIAAYVTTAPAGEVASLVIVEPFAGPPSNTGAVVSFTVIVNDFVDVAPWLSVAVQVTVVRPSGNVEPDAGTQAKV